MRRSIVLVAFVAAVACVPKPAPIATQHPEPPHPPAAAPVLGQDWRDWPYTPGTWRYRRDARGSIALFGRSDSDAVATLRCDVAARQLYLSRSGTTAGPATIRTSTVVRTLAMRPTGGTPPYVATAIAPKDPLLDAIGFSRGRFTIEQTGQAPLVLPSWAEVERVTQDCR